GTAWLLAANGSVAPLHADPGHATDCPTPSGRKWPTGTSFFEFENLEGLILVRARLEGANRRDTSGLLAVDTGAGYLALDHRLTATLGLTDTVPDPATIDFADRALPRLELGSEQIDHVTPVLALDLQMPRQVTDRPMLGLLGQHVI